jgi:hypothetical protein
MTWMKTAWTLLMVAAAGLLLGGCAGSYQARSVDIEKSTLVSPSLLEKGSGDQALYRYVNPQAVIRNYNKVMIDPVLIAKDGELDKDELENYQRLANNGYLYLTQELAKDYQIVSSPDPGTMRVQMAIVDADSSKPGRNILSSVSPIGIGLNAVKYTATGKQSGVGEISGEMKVTDASTGEILGAALDRRVGGKDPKGMVDRWYNADEALKYWAKRLSYVLCNMRAGSNCVSP